MSNQPEADKRKTAPLVVALDATVRVFAVIGCGKGCNADITSEDRRDVAGDDVNALHEKAVDLLDRLLDIDEDAVLTYFRSSFVAKQPLQDSIDFFHSLLGFCQDRTSRKQTNVSSASPSPLDKSPSEFTMLSCNISTFKIRLQREGLVAQWITRLPTEQEIPGSNPGKLVFFFLAFLYFTTL